MNRRHAGSVFPGMDEEQPAPDYDVLAAIIGFPPRDPDVMEE
ncbi:hypothetical protein AB0F91_05815 [Amycolatopsis sp. NPDC023774]